MLPFSQSQFFAVFVEYNTAIWPLQPVAALFGFTAVLMMHPSAPAWRGRAIAAILAGFWFLMGPGYHWLFFAAINPAALGFGAFFALAGVFFLVEGVVRNNMEFQWAGGARGWLAAALICYALVFYPLAGLLWLHPYPATPLFGVAPCPTTIFTLGVLLLSRYRWPLMPAGVPLAWAIVGGSAAILLHVPQDWGLLAAAVAWTAMYIIDKKRGQVGKTPSR